MIQNETSQKEKRIVTAGIAFASLEEKMAARAMAKARRQSLSAYICTLIDADARSAVPEISAKSAR